MNPFAQHKILGHLPIVGQYLSGETYPPIQVELDLTNICNSACPWCAGFDHREEHPFVLFGYGTAAEAFDNSRHRIIELIEELALYGVKSLTWTGGGEPTLHPHLRHFIQLASSYGIDNGLISNGVKDSTACIPCCQWIRYSVDAATKEGYGKQHGRPQHWETVLGNVRRAAESKGDTTVGVGFVTTADLIHEIIPFVRLWRDVPVSYIQFRPIMDNYGRSYEQPPGLAELLCEARSLDSRVVTSDAKYSAIERGETGMTTRCHGTFLETAISADGCVYSCCHLKGIEKYRLGSLHEESFRTIWERHLTRGQFDTSPDCSTFCRHYGTNKFFEESVLIERTHANFI